MPELREIPFLDGGPVQIAGAVSLEEGPDGLVPFRLPAWAREQVEDPFFGRVVAEPAGVRLRLRTAARQLELDLRAERVVLTSAPAGAPPRDGALFDVVVDDVLVDQQRAPAAGVMVLDPLARTVERREPAPVTTLVLDLPEAPGDAAQREVEIWLPYHERIALVALRADAEVRPPTPVSSPRWIHHGSSISHGGNATSPTCSWVARAAALAGLDAVNLGFSGNAVLDPCVARVIRDAEADVISLKLGINLVNADLLRRRAFRPAVEGFLDTIREGHPSTPLLLAGPIICPLVEDCPGPTDLDPASPPDQPRFRTLGRPEELDDGKLSLRLIREDLAAVVARRRAAGEVHLHHVDGLELYGPADWDTHPMPDLLHPDDWGMQLVADRFAPHLRAALAR